MVDVRRLRADEGPRLRELRLRALAAAPDAFGDTLAAAAARPAEAWQTRATHAAAGKDYVLFVAEERGHWYGLAGGLFEDDASDEAEVVSMWVDPAARGSGLSQRLLDAVTAWARAHGAASMRLWVTEGNAPAIALYERCGFAFTGEAAPLPSNAALRELAMRRPDVGNRQQATGIRDDACP